MSSPALEITDLSKSYSGRTVVDNVSLAVQPHTLTAVLGPNGAGKTTLMECVTGLRQPDSGSVSLLGLPRNSTNVQELRERVGVMLQDGGLPMAHSAGSVLRHVAGLHATTHDPGELLERLGLTEHAATKVRHLSGGQRQRLALACALVGKPEIAFLDEPSAGLDPSSRRGIHDFLEELVAEGTTAVMTTHLMTEAERLADEVVVMASGKLAAAGHPSELVGEPSIWVSGMSATDLHGVFPSATIRERGTSLEIIGASAPTLSDLAAVARTLEAAGHHPSLSYRPKSLEDLYFDVMEQR